jgi:hypothetical protein
MLSLGAGQFEFGFDVTANLIVILKIKLKFYSILNFEKYNIILITFYSPVDHWAMSS